MNRDHETEEYRFNESEHLHELNVDGKWKALTGVTTVLSVISKPALVQWSANEAVKFVQAGLTEEILQDKTKFLDFLDEAKVAHKKKKETAGEAGTKVHEEIEWMIEESINNRGGIFSESFIQPKDGLYSKQAELFYKWALENKVRFISAEKHVYSKSMWVGGIADFICEIDGKLFVGDVKTSSNIYPEHFIQASAYAEMLKEMGSPAVDGVIIVNLDKKGGFKVEKMFNPVRYFEAFKCALGLYRFTEELKTLTK